MNGEQRPLLTSYNSDHDISGHIDTTTAPLVDPFEPVTRRSVYQRKSFLGRIFPGSSSTNQDSGCDDQRHTSILPVICLAFLLAMSFGSTLGIIPSIMTERFARVNYGYSHCDDIVSYDQKPEECIQGSKDAQTAASVSELVSNILTLLTSSWMGSVSDIRGRRPLLITGVILSSMGPFSLLLTVLHPRMSGVFYYCAKTTNGLLHWMVIALSCVADVLPKHQRAAGVGLLMAAFWCGLCLAPTLAVFLSHLKVIAISCILQCSGLACAIILVPESLSPEIAVAARERHGNNSERRSIRKDSHQKVLGSLIRPIRELSIINRNSFLRLLSILAFFSGMATSGDQTLLLYYVDSVLSFDSTDIAVMFLLVGLSAVLAQAVLLRPLNNCIGERWIVVLCFVAATFSNTMYGLASDKKSLYTAVCVGALAGMAFPTISAIKANTVDPSEQGRIQGALFSIQAVSAGIGPAAMRAVDAVAKWRDLSPGSMFFFAAFLQFMALCCAYRLPKDKTNSKETASNE